MLPYFYFSIWATELQNSAGLLDLKHWRNQSKTDHIESRMVEREDYSTILNWSLAQTITIMPFLNSNFFSFVNNLFIFYCFFTLIDVHKRSSPMSNKFWHKPNLILCVTLGSPWYSAKHDNGQCFQCILAETVVWEVNVLVRIQFD